jgi:hypothetical protein
MRLDVPVNYAARMGVAEAGTYLLDVFRASFYRNTGFPYGILQIAAGQVFENEVMKNRSPEIACRAVADAAYDIWVSDLVEGNGFILEILYERAFQIGVEIVLQKDVKGLDDDGRMCRLRRCQDIASEVNFGIASPPERFTDIVPLVESAVV